MATWLWNLREDFIEVRSESANRCSTLVELGGKGER
jgi:hypothetical protein